MPKLLCAASNGIISSTSQQYVQIESMLDTGIMCHTMGVVQIICSFGDYHQSPPVAMKGTHNVCAATYTYYLDSSGRIHF